MRSPSLLRRDFRRVLTTLGGQREPEATAGKRARRRQQGSGTAPNRRRRRHRRDGVEELLELVRLTRSPLLGVVLMGCAGVGTFPTPRSAASCSTSVTVV